MGWVRKKYSKELEWMDDKAELMLKTKEELVEIIMDLDSEVNHLKDQSEG
jgi:hypothetical protein